MSDNKDIAEATRLAGELEQTARLAIAWLSKTLGMEVDVDNAALLRAQSTAAATALNTQLRADSLRLRAQRLDHALDRLIEQIRRQEGRLPGEGKPVANDSQHANGVT